MKITDELIVNFRDKVNSNSGFVFETYHNFNGKNLWHLICSCMDWISVAVRFLSKGIKNDKDIDVRAMHLYSYISAIDIVFESIIQLHRAIIKDENIPFKGRSEIFKNNILNLDDNDYFKEIRAMFGAHPVNLKHKDQRKWYASWPFDPFTSDKAFFEIRLYSNQISENDLSFSIKINELQLFFFERYSYLNTLIDEIDKQFREYCTNLANQKIYSSGDPISVLHILRSESEKRLNTDYYNNAIDELIRLFSSSTGDAALKDEEEIYKNELLLVIDDIKNNLQSMNFGELDNDKILNPDYPYGEIGYSVSKLYTFEFDHSLEPLYNYHMKVLDDFSKARYDFIHTREPNILFLKLKMMLFRNNTGKGFS